MVLKITVKTLDAQNYHFDAEDDWTVKQFKEHMESTIYVSPNEQRLIFCGRVLLDDKKLFDYDCDGKVIHLVKRPPPPLEMVRPFQFRRNNRFSDIARSINLPHITTIQIRQPSACQQHLQFDIPTSVSEQKAVTIDFSEAANWCSLSYHEYDRRFKEKFQPCSFTCFVDGTTDTNGSDRFCLGGLPTALSTPEAEWVRSLIRDGFKLTYVEGDVYLECLSTSPMFAASSVMEPGVENSLVENVLKVEPGEKVRVFADSQFSKMLAKAVTKGFESVYKLTDCCFLHLSFVKGWGSKYKRQSISQVPCWLEVQLNGPLQWIDQVLRQMRPPLQGGDSTS